MVSAMFGLMSQDQKKTNDQKKRFFDNVNGLSFPDDWETLSEEEKSKRLEKVEKVTCYKWPQPIDILKYENEKIHI